ncbi:phage tail sheath family protein [Haliangium sp.]|uniref:phage tail sheath family protein n=1 Tax=Haliangium sp. TaxID=2663208 RepID=UPI003D10EEFD
MLAPTYPGVYIEEIPSGVRTITGAATSIAAFVGRALRGPVDEPVTIISFGEFERVFGGLWLDSSLGYAVRDFFLNGGGQAIVVRVFGGDAKAQTARLALDDTHALEAVSPGTWGGQLRVRVDALDAKVADEVSRRHELATDQLFNLRIKDLGSGVEEFHQNLTVVADHARSIERVLAKQSALARYAGSLPASSLPPKQTALPDPGKRDPWWQSTAEPGDGEDPTPSYVQPAAPPSDGAALRARDIEGSESDKTGMYALEKADIFNLLCIPPIVEVPPWQSAVAYCERRRAMLIVDPDLSWDTAAKAKSAELPTTSANAAIFFPALKQANPLRENQLETFAPCGAIAGVIARTDSTRGIWKAPAGLDATIKGTTGLSVSLVDAEIGQLNPLGINCLRTAPAAGRVVWGARTMRGDDRLASEWKYISVRRLALFIEETLYRGTQWAVFEPNDEPLWAQLRLNIGTFMHGLFRQGAFQGSTPDAAYFVQCDRDTTTQRDIDQGVVNIVVGFAPLKPAEFVIIKLQQIAGQSVA